MKQILDFVKENHLDSSSSLVLFAFQEYKERLYKIKTFDADGTLPRFYGFNTELPRVSFSHRVRGCE